MYEISVRLSFSAAHNLREYHGKCENMHGHNWLVEAKIASKKLQKNGILLDFKILKKDLSDMLEELDHTYLNHHVFFKKNNPTSENIAKFIFDKLNKKYKLLYSVSVWESEHSCATYRNK